MKNIKLNINGVNITLTEDQLKQIDNQRTKNYSIDDIVNCSTDEKAYELACEILNQEPFIINDDLFKSMNQQNLAYRFLYQIMLETIIKACSFIDNNNQLWVVDFAKDYNKYYSWWNRVSGGWVFSDVLYDGSHSHLPVGFYYKENKTCEKVSKRFNYLYSSYLG